MPKVSLMAMPQLLRPEVESHHFLHASFPSIDFTAPSKPWEVFTWPDAISGLPPPEPLRRCASSLTRSPALTLARAFPPTKLTSGRAPSTPPKKHDHVIARLGFERIAEGQKILAGRPFFEEDAHGDIADFVGLIRERLRFDLGQLGLLLAQLFLRLSSSFSVFFTWAKTSTSPAPRRASPSLRRWLRLAK
jgi:hypothetical protein